MFILDSFTIVLIQTDISYHCVYVDKLGYWLVAAFVDNAVETHITGLHISAEC